MTEAAVQSRRLPPRHALRALAQRMRIPMGPRSAGARIVECGFDREGRWRSRDVTICHGATVLLAESPAPALSAGLIAELSHATRSIISADEVSGHQAVVVFALTGSSNWHLLHVSIDHDQWWASHGSCAMRLAVRCWRPQGLPADAEDDPLTAINGIDPKHCRVHVGDRPGAGTVVAQLETVGSQRSEALAGMRERLGLLLLGGISHDARAWCEQLCGEAARSGQWHPGQAVLRQFTSGTCHVEHPGMETTVQDWPGRQGAWEVGVPPSGPMDDRNFRLANRAVGNDPGAPALEALLRGPTLRFADPTVVAVTGAPVEVLVDGVAHTMFAPITVPAGSTLVVGAVRERGLRVYIAIRGGIDVPRYLGSAATFTLGGFGGHAGRPLVCGDVLAVGADTAAAPEAIAPREQPRCQQHWHIGITLGPHAAPEFLTPAGLEQFLDARWRVSPRSNRTGIRLDGPKPQWAREDGGEAGLHPSNIHDNGYAIGAVDFTGDTPVVLGPDGPSCGGFVCPVVVPSGERWKLGQLRPGDTVQWQVIDADQAVAVRRQPGLALRPQRPYPSAIAHQRPASPDHPGLCMRVVGDGYCLLEYGPAELDIALRLRVHLLDQYLRQAAISGIIDLVPGIRSLLVHVDPDVLSLPAVHRLLLDADERLDPEQARVPTRRLRLPLSWDDPSTRTASELYQRTVNPDAPWCPWNIEFIRRINGLSSVDEVFDIVFGAEYLVMGLGDVYLGAPVSTPIDPRHRLVTTKYNPARTWTPENAVGIGGAYMCIYGMEGPGGYQFVGRTVPVWNTWRSTPCFEPGTPWLLRQFDTISWYSVGHEELLDLRSDMRSGRFVPDIQTGSFDLSEHLAFCEQHADSITAARQRQTQAFSAERQRWAQAAQASSVNQR
ncbi:MAG: 5-oxoprolinase/urea amidolyase family protein [Planctomycetota bacterium]|nr:MAG: 5-oxoprolinase/urea amidolyase family protein [Planctomycetota bacterium]